MDVMYKPMGVYQTNCYIIKNEEHSLIIDPGVDALNWVIENAHNPVAILNTHAHFDHVWSNQVVKEHFDIPIYCPEEDIFLLSMDQFGMQMPHSKADIAVEPGQSFELAGFTFTFHHFPGHTPGTSMIEFEDCYFSGDFIFDGSIGRTDFPFSVPADMKRSIERFLAEFDDDKIIYPGHNQPTNVKRAHAFLPRWLAYID